MEAVSREHLTHAHDSGAHRAFRVSILIERRQSVKNKIESRLFGDVKQLL